MKEQKALEMMTAMAMAMPELKKKLTDGMRKHNRAARAVCILVHLCAVRAKQHEIKRFEDSSRTRSENFHSPLSLLTEELFITWPVLKDTWNLEAVARFVAFREEKDSGLLQKLSIRDSIMLF